MVQRILIIVESDISHFTVMKNGNSLMSARNDLPSKIQVSVKLNFSRPLKRRLSNNSDETYAVTLE